MPPLALALVLLAGFIHASWNFAAKKAGGDWRFATYSSLVLAVFWGPLALWLGWREIPTWGATQWLLVAVSGALHLAYYLFLLRGYRLADLTVVYPMARGSGPLLSSMAALVVLGERISGWGLLGIACIVVGVFFIAGGWGLLRQAQQVSDRQRLHRGLFYGIMSGVFISAYTVLDGYAVKVMLLSPILLDYVGNAFRIVLMSPKALANRQDFVSHWKQQWRYALLVGIISPVSYVLVLWAVTMAPLSHVAPAREVSMLFAALLGGHLLGEGGRASRMIGAVVMALGVTSLALG